MTKNVDNQTVDSGFVNSKLGKALLTIVAVFLVFAGPTYVIYGLSVVLKVSLVASFVIGIVLFIVGLFLMRYLVQKKIIV